MDIALRKQRILAAVVETYISTGEPVGSKSLQQTQGIDVSSATIRNELADLTATGLLKQPHTSAGRVPTQKGYRYYVDNLMRRQQLDERMKVYIYSCLQSCSDAPENILKSSADLVSEITGTAAVATTPLGEDIRVRKIKFVQTGRYTSMVVVVTSAGMVKSRLFRCDFDITEQMLNVFDRALNERLAGEPLSAVNRPLIQSIAASYGELSLLMPDMLVAVMEACKEASQLNVYLSGETKLLYNPDSEFVTRVKAFEYLSDNDNRKSLLKNVPDGTHIYIGGELSQPQLKNNSLVATKYRIENQPAGAIALITPLRVDYAKAVAIVEQTAKSAGELIGEVITEEK